MKRTCRMILALCLAILFCSPVMAQHSGPYVGGFVGGNMLMPARSTDDLGSFRLKFDPALFGSAVLGWDFEPNSPMGEGRIELEYTRRSNPLDKVKFAEGNFKGGGDMTADSLLVNCIGVFRNNTRWSPYALLGVGAARIKASDLQVTGQPLSNSSTYVFAYQAGMGIDLELTNYLSLDLGYRFFSSIPPQFTESNGRKFKMDYYTHNVVLGFRFGF